MYYFVLTVLYFLVLVINIVKNVDSFFSFFDIWLIIKLQCLYQWFSNLIIIAHLALLKIVMANCNIFFYNWMQIAIYKKKMSEDSNSLWMLAVRQCAMVHNLKTTDQYYYKNVKSIPFINSFSFICLNRYSILYTAIMINIIHIIFITNAIT